MPLVAHPQAQADADPDQQQTTYRELDCFSISHRRYSTQRGFDMSDPHPTNPSKVIIKSLYTCHPIIVSPYTNYVFR